MEKSERKKLIRKVACSLMDIWDCIRKPFAFFAMIAIVWGAMWIIDAFTGDTDFLEVFLIFMAITPVVLFIVYKLTNYDLIKPALWGGGIAALITVPFSLIGGAVESETDTKPASIDYHSAADLRKATGVEFPEVTPVDSTYHEDWNNWHTEVKFVAPHGLKKSFYKRLDRACKTDSVCWRKSPGDKYEKKGYYYYILPDRRPFDRTKGDGWRMTTDSDGNRVRDWDGEYISVFIPIDGDTITVEDGWAR